MNAEMTSGGRWEFDSRRATCAVTAPSMDNVSGTMACLGSAFCQCIVPSCIESVSDNKKVHRWRFNFTGNVTESPSTTTEDQALNAIHRSLVCPCVNQKSNEQIVGWQMNNVSKTHRKQKQRWLKNKMHRNTQFSGTGPLQKMGMPF